MAVSEAASGSEFDAGSLIIGHVSNSSHEHPVIHLPSILGVDLSVTKHVLMLWVVAGLVFLLLTRAVRRFLKQEQPVPTGFMNAVEFVVVFIRDSIVIPNVGKKFAPTWAPLVLTLFFFILTANAIGMIPIFEVIGLANSYVLHSHYVEENVLHGGATATGNYNVTAALATVTFFAIIAAGTLAHGFIRHWKNLAPPGMALPVYFILVPIEIIGMFVKPFALTMRLAANMTGGHIAILAITSFVFIFNQVFQSAWAGIGVGVLVSVPMSVAISALEIIVILVQAYVFTILTAVFIGMAINVHH